MTGSEHGSEPTAASFAERLDAQLLGALEIVCVFLGDRLGLYGALATGGPRTSVELSEELGLAERYVREWLEQQAVSGVLEVDDPTAGAAERRYRLPAGHETVLLDAQSLDYRRATVRGTVATALELSSVLEVFRTGGGLAWHEVEYETDEVRDANRAWFERDLAGWLAADRGVHARLSDASRPAWVADVGCGAGWSSIAIAGAYEGVRVHGIDANGRAIELARRHADRARVGDRVTFAVADAADLDGGPYELVCFFECLHDMSRPVDALRRARELLAEGGAVLVGDEKTAGVFTAPGDELERSLYAWSVLSCLPYGMSGEDPAGTGAVMRPARLRRYGEAAGFERFEDLPIEHPAWRFTLLQP